MTRAIVRLLALLPLLAWPAVARTADPEPGAELLGEAAAAMSAQRYGQAMELYERARSGRPQSAEIPFNMGVAAYRQGDLERAARLFDEARLLAGDPALRARAAYNLGTTAFRRSLDRENPTGSGDDLQAATDELRRALGHFRETLDGDPSDADARANGELAWRWLEQLEQMQQQQQQSGGEGQEQDGDNREQQDQEQPPQDQPGEQGEQQESPPRPGSSPDESEPRPQQDQPPQSSEPQEQEQEQSPSPQEQEQAGAEPQEDPESDEREDRDAAGREQQEQQEQQPMSREEAERLLQGVRDRERRREESRARAQRQAPVDKDW